MRRYEIGIFRNKLFGMNITFHIPFQGKRIFLQ